VGRIIVIGRFLQLSFAPQGDGGDVVQNPVGVTETTQKVRPLVLLVGVGRPSPRAINL